MKFFIYTRKSVITGKGESIENQVEMCKDYISVKFPDKNSNEIYIYEDEGFSAKNTKRPQFKKMINDIKSIKPDFIVCYRLDRISRNVSDFSALIENLNNNNISFICIKEEFDTSKPMGKAMMYIASVFAQLERETIAERVRDNMLLLARSGRWLGGTAPTGYTSEKAHEFIIDGHIKSSCFLKELPDEISVINTIFDVFSDSGSISHVSKYLIKNNITSRNGKYFSLLGIKDILQNPVYCTADKNAYDYFRQNQCDVCFEEDKCTSSHGLISYNKRDYRKKNAPRRSMDKWIIAIGKHKGLISGKRWVEVQNILKNNIPGNKNFIKSNNDYSLFSGMIYCGKCGCKMYAKPRPNKNKEDRQFDYICENKLRGGIKICDCQNINGKKCDDIICDFLLNYIHGNSEIYNLLNKLKNSIIKNQNQSPINLVNNKIINTENKINNIIHNTLSDNLNNNLIKCINSEITELNKHLKHLYAEQKNIEKSNINNDKKLPEINMIAQNLTDFINMFKKLPVFYKRKFTKIFIQKIIWDNKNMKMVINNSFI